MADKAFSMLVELKDKFSAPLKAIQSPFEKFKDNIDATKKQLRSLNDAGKSLTWAEKASAQLEKLTPKLETQRKKLAELETKLSVEPRTYKGRERQAYTRLQARVKKQIAAIETLEAREQEYQVSIDASRKKLKAVGIETDNLSEAREQLTQATDKARASTVRYKDALTRLKGVGDAVRTGLTRIKYAAVGLTATVAGLGFATSRIVGGMAEQARDLKIASQAFNVGTESLQVWQMAGQQFNLEADKVRDIMKDVQDKLGDLSITEGGEAKDLFEKLNLDIREFKRLKPDQALLKIAEALDQSKLTHSEKIFLLESLANDATLLMPLLDDNAKALREMQVLAKDSGTLMSDKDINTLMQAQQQFKQMGMYWKGVKTEFSVAIADIWVKSGVGEVLKDWMRIGIAFAKWKMESVEFRSWLKAFPGDLKSGTKKLITFVREVGDLIETVSNGITTVKDFVGGWKNLLLLFVGFKAIGVISSLLKIGAAITGLPSGLALLTAGFAKFSGLLGVVKRGLIVLSIAMRMNPLGLLVTAVVTAATLIYKNWDKIVSTFKEAKESLQSMSWSEIAVTIANGIATLPLKLTQIGVDAIAGLIDGLTGGDGAKRAVQAAKDIATNIAGSVKDFFGIRSPSRLMKAYGQNITEGLALGIDAKSQQAIASMQAMNDGLTRQLPTGVIDLNTYRTERQSASSLPQQQSLAAVLGKDMNAAAQHHQVGGQIMVNIRTQEGVHASTRVQQSGAVGITANVGRAAW